MSPSPAEEQRGVRQAFGRHSAEICLEIQRAEALLQSGRAAQARELFLALVEKMDGFDAEWGERLFKMGGSQDSRTMRAAVLWRLSHPNFLLDKFEEAERNLDDALELVGDIVVPPVVDILQAQGAIYQRQEKFDRAAACFERAGHLATHPNLQLWERACNNFELLAGCFMSAGKRDACLGALDQAIDLARIHGLGSVERNLQLYKFGLRVMGDPTGWDLAKFDKERVSLKSLAGDKRFQANAYLIEAHYWAVRGDGEGAKVDLERALELAQGDSVTMLSVLIAQAQYHAFGLLGADRTGTPFGWQQDLHRAIDLAERAHKLAVESGMPSKKVCESLQALIGIRYETGDPSQRRLADRGLAELRRVPGIDLVHALLARSRTDYAGQQFEKALAGIEEAQRYVSSADMLGSVLNAKAIALTALQRNEEALKANLDAIDVLKPLAARRMFDNSWMIAWRDRLEHLADLYENAAVLSAQAGKVREAFDLAEAGRGQLLRQQLTDASTDLAGSVTFNDVRDMLAPERAALALFCVGYNRTLVLLMDPDEAQPSWEFIDLTRKRLQELFPVDLGEAWKKAAANALPELSEKLMGALGRVVGKCVVLYILGQRQLSSVPFAALSFADGNPLVKHCALAWAPSATTLKLVRSRPPAAQSKTCLAVGVGHAGPYRFEDQAAAIQALDGWERHEDLGPTPSKASFLKAAPGYSSLFLACHGNVEPGAIDALAASRVELANRELLTAKDVFSELNGRLHADLVFLNACASGRFQSRLSAEAGGFGPAFLRAGARSVISTMAHVDPGEAQELATEFYNRWLRGNTTKATALQNAQLAMYKDGAGAAPISWGSYLLIGDYR